MSITDFSIFTIDLVYCYPIILNYQIDFIELIIDLIIELICHLLNPIKVISFDSC